MKLNKFLLAVPIIISALHCSVANAGFVEYMDEISEKANLLRYEKVSDKELVAVFYKVDEDGKNSGLVKEITDVSNFKVFKVSPDSLTITRLYYKTENLQEISSEMRAFSKTPMDDIIGQRYVKFANQRGNEVRQYRPAMTLALNKIFSQNFRFKPDGKVLNFLGSENSLLEYSKDGKIVSIMTRSQQAFQNYSAQSYQYINIIFGAGDGNLVQNRFSNSFFADNFMRNLTEKDLPIIK